MTNTNIRRSGLEQVAEAPRIERARSWSRRARKAHSAEAQDQLEQILKEIGEDRAEADREKQAAVEAMYLVKEEALAQGVPMARIAELMGVSRQWLYNMGNFRGREAA